MEEQNIGHGAIPVSAETRLAELGYKQELPRTLSMMSILGLSFAIMAVPFVSRRLFDTPLRV